MSSARDRTEWMSLDGLKAHYTMHALQRDLLDAGLERRGTEGPAFILLHTGAALRPDGAESRREVMEAIEDRVRLHEEEAKTATEMAEVWNGIKKRIAGMEDDEAWRNPLWERELLNTLRKELQSINRPLPERTFKKDRLAAQKFRRGFDFRDVVCIHKDRFSAFKVNREQMQTASSLPIEWKELFPEVEFRRTVFRWMAFPKDLSGGTKTAYLQFGNMAFRLAGNGHTRRYDHEAGQWIEKDSVESWVS